jgi:hypothetical protein
MRSDQRVLRWAINITYNYHETKSTLDEASQIRPEMAVGIGRSEEPPNRAYTASFLELETSGRDPLGRFAVWLSQGRD